jgi:hypothetical protein
LASFPICRDMVLIWQFLVSAFRLIICGVPTVGHSNIYMPGQVQREIKAAICIALLLHERTEHGPSVRRPTVYKCDKRCAVVVHYAYYRRNGFR